MKRLFGLILSLVMVVALALPTATPVSADANTISGTICKTDGTTPIANAVVKVYTYVAGASVILWNSNFSSALTGTNGQYSISGIPTGNYIVTAYAEDYQRVYSSGGTSLTSATPLAIPTNGSVNFNLGIGGKISGTVTLGAQPLPGVSIFVTVQGVAGAVCAAISGPNGQYVLDGLPYSNNYMVSSPWPGYTTGIDPHLIREWWSGVNFNQLATLVTVDAAHVNPTIDMPMKIGDTISGYVVDQGGQPVAGASVVIYDINYISGTPHSTGAGITDSNGYFKSWGIPVGTYAVQVTATTPVNYASQWYQNKDLNINATPIIISGTGDGNKDVVLENIKLAPGATISGTVMDTSTPPKGIANCNVSASDYATNMNIANAKTDTSGNYTLLGLPAGTFNVMANPSASSLNYNNEWYNNKFFVQYADPVSVSPGNTTPGINFVLQAPLNLITVNSSTTYSFSTKDDRVNNVQTDAAKSWNININNNSDNSGRNVTGLQDKMTGTGSLHVDYANGNNPSGNIPPAFDSSTNSYTWNLGNLGQGQQANANVGSNNKYPITPGFNITRSISLPDGNGDQLLTLDVVIPNPAAPVLNSVFININAPKDNVVNPTLSIPTETYANTSISINNPTNNNVSIAIKNPAPGQDYTFTTHVNAHLLSPVYVYMPQITVTGQINVPNDPTVGPAETIGSLVTFSDNDKVLGTCTWSANDTGGPYVWGLNQYLQYSILMLGSQDQWNQVSINSNTLYSFRVTGDSYTNGPTDIAKSWGINVNNSGDTTRAAVTGLQSTLNYTSGTLNIDWASGNGPIGNVPPSNDKTAKTYTWSNFGNLSPNQGASGNVGSNTTYPVTPGFNVTRSMPAALDSDGYQTLTLHVKPQTVTPALNNIIININAPGDTVVSPVLTLPNETYTDTVSSLNGNNSLKINITNPNVSNNYLFTIRVKSNSLVSALVYMPQINVTGQVNLPNDPAFGPVLTGGLAVTFSDSDKVFGSWTWLAADNGVPYLWTLNRFLQYQINMPGSEDLLNQVFVGSNTVYSYNSPNSTDDSYNNSSVNFAKGWNIYVNNSSDNSGQPVTGLQSTLDYTSGTLNIDWANGNGPNGNVPPSNDKTAKTYTWSNFGNLSPNQGASGNVGSKTTCPVTPGFNVTRSMPAALDSNGNQTLTIHVIPQTPVAPVPALNNIFVNINTWQDNVVNPQLFLPPETYQNTGVNLQSRYNLNININNPKVGQDYVFSIPVQVNSVIPSYVFMPHVNVTGQVGLTNDPVIGPAVTVGAAVAFKDNDQVFGSWTWSATDTGAKNGGPYLWNLSRFLQYQVNLLSSEETANNISINSNINYNYYLAGDDYNNVLVTGSRDWNVNLYNNPDGSTAKVTGVTSIFTNSGSLAVDWANGNGPNGDTPPTVGNSTPKTYTWNFPDLSQDVGANCDVGSQSTFTPGFIIHREVTVPDGGQQMLKLDVTPQSSPTFINLYISINTWKDSTVNPQLGQPVINLPQNSNNIRMNPSLDHYNLLITIPSPAVGTKYSFSIPITDNFTGGSSFTYMPQVFVTGQSMLVPTAVTSGNGLILNDSIFGNWTWSTTGGPYIWNSGQYLQYAVNLQGTQSKANTTTTGADKTANYSAGAQTLNMTATITSPNGIVNDGTVTFTIRDINNVVVASPVTSVTVNNGNANANYLLPAATPVGKYSIEAIYNGGMYFNSGSKATNTLTVVTGKKVDQTLLFSFPNPSEAGAQVIFAGIVTAGSINPANAITFNNGKAALNSGSLSSVSGSNVPTGSLTFFDAQTKLGVSTLDKFGFFTFTISLTSVGNHSITAKYSGDTNYSESTSAAITQLVKYRSFTSLASSLKAPVFGQQVSFTATISASGATPTGTVTFRDGLTVIGTVTIADNTSVLTTAGLDAGTHIISATYSGDASFMGSISTMTQTVKKADTKASITSSKNPSVQNQSVTFTAGVSSTTPGTGIPQGTVTFKDGSKTLSTKTLDSSGQATYTTTSLSSGSHSIIAVYGGADDFNGSNSTILTQQINK